jgi:thiamine biosynthesis lipoprotein
MQFSQPVNIHSAPATFLRWGLLVLTLSVSFKSSRGEDIFRGPTMGTSFEVIVNAQGLTIDLDEVGTAIAEELQAVNLAMSTYLEDSEVSRFNRMQSDDWFEVSPATFQVISRAQEISKASDGAFDITVGPLVNRWNFGPNKQVGEKPDAEETAKLLEEVGYEFLELQIDPPAIRKLKPHLEIDLSAIAKGFAVDQVALRLEQYGIKSYLVEVGGEVRCRGSKSNGDLWRTGIRRPIPGRGEIVEAVELDQRSIATSGDYENFVVIDGASYSHTIDPNTGAPIQNGLTSASVVADDCMTADALATAVSVMGYQKGKELVESMEGEVFTITRSNGQFLEQWTTDFPFTENKEPEPASFWGLLLAGFVVFAIAIVAMSVGVIFSNRQIKGSCGGLASLHQGQLTPACEMCGQKTKECQELQDAIQAKKVQDDCTADEATQA